VIPLAVEAETVHMYKWLVPFGVKAEFKEHSIDKAYIAHISDPIWRMIMVPFAIEAGMVPMHELWVPVAVEARKKGACHRQNPHSPHKSS